MRNIIGSIILKSTYGTLPTPVRDYYNFNGWYTSAEGGTKITEITKVSLTKNQTLYAHWTKKVETKTEEYTYNTGRTFFNYSHYKYWNTTYNNWYYTYSYAAAAANGNNIIYEELGWSTTELHLNIKFGNAYQSYGTYVNGYPWFNEVTKPETATATTTYYRYADREKVYTYYFKKEEYKESADNPSGKENVSNVTKYVKYIAK